MARNPGAMLRRGKRDRFRLPALRKRQARHTNTGRAHRAGEVGGVLTRTTMIARHDSISFRDCRLARAFLPCAIALALAACGGGGGGSNVRPSINIALSDDGNFLRNVKQVFSAF